MTGSITRGFRNLNLWCAFGGYSHFLNAQVTDVESGHCAAMTDPSYFSSLSLADEEASELCFVGAGEIDTTVDQNSLVGVAAQPQLNNLTQNRIRLPDWQIKSKSYLKNKSLLITVEPYNRNSLPKLCHNLIQVGFQNPKILADWENWYRKHPWHS